MAELSPHIVYLASAGTGKTHQLTNRYIELIAGGVPPQAILATTFTRKAAGEILERILKRLSDAAATEKGLKDLCESLPIPFTHERCARLTASLAQALHRLNIGTIDAFFTSILTGFAFELGVSPSWEIIDDEADAQLRALAVSRAMDVGDRQTAVERLGTLIRMLHRGGFGRGVHSRMLRSVQDWYSQGLASLEHPAVWAVIGPAGPTPDAEEMTRLAEAVRSMPVASNSDGEPNGHWLNAREALAGLVMLGDWESIAKSGLVSSIANGKEMFQRQPYPSAARVVLIAVLDAARRALLHSLLERNTAARDLLTDFDRAYAALKRRKGVLRFDDVPRALLGAKLGERLDDLYYRLDGKIQHLLLDEFQDTSLDQFAVLRPMLENLAAGDLGSVFCVGDVKQSLYSWRGGEPRLLPAIPERWPQFRVLPLDENRRSSPVIIDAVNAVFGSLATNPALERSREAGAEWGGMFETHTAHHAELPGLVRLMAAPIQAEEPVETGDDDPFDVAPDDPQAARIVYIAEHAASIARESPAARIAILTRTNRLIPRLIIELRERHKLSAVGEHGNPLTDTPAAAAAISALFLADHPGDSAALFHLAVMPLGRILGLSWSPTMDRHLKARQIASRLRLRIARDGIADFLRWLQRRLEPEMDDFGHARFDQLIDLAEEMPGLSPSQFARLAREKPVEPPPRDGDPIRVMTIHKAKGLEFDAVILPELDPPWRPRADALLTDRRDEAGEADPLSSIAAITTWPSEPYRNVDAQLRDMYDAHVKRQHVEELCLMYVAMTRARRRLDMIIFPAARKPSDPDKPRSPSAARILHAALAGGAAIDPGVVLFESRSDLVWFDGLTPRGREHAGELEVRLAAPASIPAGRLARKSPSAVDDRIQLADVWKPPASATDPRNRGTAFHAMFESIEWLEGSPPVLPEEQSLRACLERHGFPREAVDTWVGEFRECLRGEVSALLSRARYTSRKGTLEVRREWSFAVREVAARDSEHILNGAIDRVVIGRDSGRAVWAEIVDFKTDDIGGGDVDAIARSLAHYRPQLEAYRRAVASMLGLGVESVSACLAFASLGRVVAIKEAAPQPPEPFPDSLFPPPAAQ